MCEFLRDLYGILSILSGLSPKPLTPVLGGQQSSKVPATGGMRFEVGL